MSHFIKLKGDLRKSKYWVMMNLPTFAFLHQTCVSLTVLSGIYGMQSPLLTTFLRNPIFLSISLCAFRLGSQFSWYKKSIGMSECPNKNQTLLYNCTNERIL